VKYEPIGINFKGRGKRSKEQIEVMRALWFNELITYEGRWNKIRDAGLHFLPPQRPIPI